MGGKGVAVQRRWGGKLREQTAGLDTGH
jgi:hypothetical protein